MHTTTMATRRGPLADALQEVGARHVSDCEACRTNAEQALRSNRDVLVNYTATERHIVAVCHDE